MVVKMAKRCVFGCFPNKTLFSIPRLPWLRARWLEFLHFEEEGLTVNSRLCSRHFTPECFQNFTQHEMGFAKVLYLTDAAVPSVYTVGTSQSMKPLTRDVGCQCTAQTSKKSVSVQVSCSVSKPKRRSKAIQVKPLGHSVGTSSENFGTNPEPQVLTSTPIKCPRMEESKVEFNDCSLVTVKEPTDFTYEPEIAEDNGKLFLAALHYNEHADQRQACNQSGEPSVGVRWPKHKKGEYSLFSRKTAPTYNYVDTLLRLLLEEVVLNPGSYEERLNELKIPDHLCDAFERPDLQEAVARNWSFFSPLHPEWKCSSDLHHDA
ncbi:uncharacterized protein LOC127418939 isoform X4 [Myxocyprinus asiaticus]|uniref:uncharacterized protein LOC127418939 isoform X4 n=1 Tax=Myxocyprinus asiaticus TaxID=70543 RepID=UPI0022236696|nr:uncharacterized protein LOC127418939 isoform X4 [Myxocyprinus asiaticus]